VHANLLPRSSNDDGFLPVKDPSVGSQEANDIRAGGGDLVVDGGHGNQLRVTARLGLAQRVERNEATGIRVVWLRIRVGSAYPISPPSKLHGISASNLPG
jgi:hypothetical protein